MAANNTVEATLRSKYEDGIEAGVENTRKLMQSAFSSMKDGGAAAAAGVEAAFESTVGALESWRSQLSKAADDSDSSFKKMSLGAAAFGIASVEVFLRASKAAADFALETIKEASEYFQVKQSFDAVTSAAGAQVNMLGELRKATEGQVSSTTLMSNASRVLSAQLPGMNEMYPKLVENVARLAKAFGKDATEAQDALTNALIRGMSRGLGPAIGVHLAVKDAVSEMAASMDVNASKLTDSSKLTAFYNELLAQTDAHIKTLPPSYLTLEEVMKAAKNAQKDLTNELGAAALHSGVLQELMKQLQEAILGFGVSADQQNKVALRTNDILISLLRTGANFIDVLNVVYISGKAVADTLIFLANIVGTVLAGAVTGIISLLYPLSEGLARIPLIGKYFRGAADDMKFALDFSAKATEEFGRGALHSFDGAMQGFGGAGDAARKLAEEMEKLRGKTIDSTGVLKKHGDASTKAAADAKELEKQLVTLRDLMFQLSQSTASPEQRDLEEAAKQGAEVTRLTLAGTEQRAAGIEQIWATYRQKQQARRDAEQAAADQAEQQRLQKVHEFEDQLLGAQSSGYDKAEQQLRQHLDKIYQLTSGADADAIELTILANGEYLAAIDKLNAQALQKEIAAGEEQKKLRKEEQQKAINDAISAANTIQQAIALAAKGAISQKTAQSAWDQLPTVIDSLKRKLAELRAQPIVSDEQLQQIDKLQIALDKLNKLSFHPFQGALQQMKDEAKQFAGQAGQAFSNFFSDLVSGQDGAGKKLLAAFVGMIGQMFTHMGIYLIQTGAGEVALALTMLGAMQGHTVPAGMAAIAAGLALSALGGALSGAGASSSGSSSSTPAPSGSSSSSPQNSNPATISVGASGGPQNSGSAQQTQHIIQLEIKPTDAFVVNAVTKNVSGNGQIRTMIKKAANG